MEVGTSTLRLKLPHNSFENIYQLGKIFYMVHHFKYYHWHVLRQTFP